MTTVVLERAPADSVTRSNQTLRKRRVFIFLTRFGFIYGLTLLVMLIGAINYNNSLAYALTFLLAGLFITAMLHTYSNLRGLIISTAIPEEVFAGEFAQMPVFLDNRNGPARVAIEISAVSAKSNKSKKTKQTIAKELLNLDAATITNFQLRIKTEKRGYLDPGRIKLASTWPLGLFRAWSYVDKLEKGIVYPSPEGVEQLPPETPTEDDLQKGASKGNDDFKGFRRYQPGDSLRAIDWKAYARADDLLLKQFQGNGSQKILLDWRFTEQLGDIESRLSQMSLWVIRAETEGLLYSLHIPDRGIEDFSSGSAHKRNCLRRLSLFGLL